MRIIPEGDIRILRENMSDYEYFHICSINTTVCIIYATVVFIQQSITLTQQKCIEPALIEKT